MTDDTKAGHLEAAIQWLIAAHEGHQHVYGQEKRQHYDGYFEEFRRRLRPAYPEEVSGELVAFRIEVNRSDLERNDLPPPEEWTMDTLRRADSLGLIYSEPEFTRIPTNESETSDGR